MDTEKMDTKMEFERMMEKLEKRIAENKAQTKEEKEEFFRDLDLIFIKQYEPLSHYYGEEWRRALENSNRELNKWIDSNPYLETKTEEEREDFGKALLLCGRLAIFAAAELSIMTNRKENFISVSLVAPHMYFQPRQLLVLQEITMVASECSIHQVGVDEGAVLMDFLFYFPNPNHLLSQIRNRLL